MDTAEPHQQIHVEVVYALPDKQPIHRLCMAAGSTALEAVQGSGVLRQYPELEVASLKLGIFSQPCFADTLLRDGDRVEIYRPLSIDPMDARRRRAEVSKARNSKA